VADSAATLSHAKALFFLPRQGLLLHLQHSVNIRAAHNHYGPFPSTFQCPVSFSPFLCHLQSIASPCLLKPAGSPIDNQLCGHMLDIQCCSDSQLSHIVVLPVYLTFDCSSQCTCTSPPYDSSDTMPPSLTRVGSLNCLLYHDGGK